MAKLSSLDAGYFGAGVYFSTNLEYALSYTAGDEGNEDCVLLCYLLYGKCFPVVEPPTLVNEEDQFYGCWRAKLFSCGSVE